MAEKAVTPGTGHQRAVDKAWDAQKRQDTSADQALKNKPNQPVKQ